MKRTVTTSHRSTYPDPISFRAGETVTLTGRCDEEYPGWVWIESADGKGGWAPEDYLANRSDQGAVASSDYSARELDTAVGELLEANLELNGWLWCRNKAGEEGWIPAMTTKPA